MLLRPADVATAAAAPAAAAAPEQRVRGGEEVTRPGRNELRPVEKERASSSSGH